ncbi:TPA: IS66 family transposase [Kluyvera georgiana]|nr:IS66 family transposase [Kluyvera georgiana]
MITLPTGTRIWIIAGVTDMRCGFNGLASKVQNTLKDDPFSGHIFVFRGRNGKMVKILWADRDGLCLFAKRLERGRFVWPVTREGKVHLTPAQLSMLLEGIINTAFRVIETVRPKLACSRCDCIVQAALPPKPIERSYASPGLLARIIMAKFAEHLPLYRQAEIYARQGVGLSRNTMGRWVDIMGEQLRPLYDELNHYVLMPGKVHADDTPVNVLEPGQGKTRTGRLWVYVRDDRNAGSTMPAAVWFSYSPDRKGIHPQRHLAGYSGILQADAYAGYNPIYENGRVTEAACMAHARRKIHDVRVRHPTAVTTEALNRIGALYAIESEIRGSPAEERLVVRKSRTVPLMQSLYDWIHLQMTALSRHSDTAKAFTYLLKQWDALNEYCRNGWVEIDNNLCENALRVVALGRRNYMFFGSDGGGDSAAVMYSLIGSCKLNGIEPETWLRHVISVINTWPANRVKELLPWNVTLSVN